MTTFRALLLVLLLSGNALAATFGHTGTTGTSTTIEGMKRSYIITAPANGRLDSVSVYLDFTDNGGGQSVAVKCAVYEWEGTDPTQALRTDSSAQRTIAATTADGWQGFAMVNRNFVVNNGERYQLVVWAGSMATDDVAVIIQDNTGDSVASTTQSITIWPGSQAMNVDATERRMSIYATYTGSGTKGTFGWQGIGATQVTAINNIRMGHFKMGNKGVYADSIYVALDDGPPSAANNFKCAIYEWDSSAVTNGETEQRSINVVSSPAWYGFDFTTNPLLNADSNYVIMVWTDGAGGGSVTANYLNTGGPGFYTDAETYGAWPTPAWTATDVTAAISEYVVYVETLTVATTPARRKKLLQNLNGTLWQEAKSCFAGAEDALVP